MIPPEHPFIVIAVLCGIVLFAVVVAYCVVVRVEDFLRRIFR